MDASKTLDRAQLSRSQFLETSKPLGKPRLGKYPKLIARFRRNLAFICDSEKGGMSCAAIGLEDNEVCYKFWFASNAADGKTLRFLKEALETLASLKNAATQMQDGCKKSFLRKCVRYSKKRINGEWSCLQRAIRGIREMRANSALQKVLFIWLDSLVYVEDHVKLCHMVYGAYMSGFKAMLDRRARDDGRRNRVGEMRSPFADAKHSIGRLAQHIISHEELVRDAHEISHILESHNVCMVDAVSYPPRPVADSHTTLDGALDRIFSHSDTEKNEVKRILLEIDRQSHSTAASETPFLLFTLYCCVRTHGPSPN
ncbi:hypothetical protein ACCO45_012616 [Purpureocillium lilacinum]|uniref:Uncharacterized protein n=1 Tax=Purpureocillium lilacinum TaxID=33203 RepID=A0ACC4DBL0_PURLI